jgi:hypothetical protein
MTGERYFYFYDFYSIQNLHLTKTDSLKNDFDYMVSAEQLSLRGVRFMVHRIERIVLFSLYLPFWVSVKGIMQAMERIRCEMLGVAQREAEWGGGGGDSYLFITERVVQL